MYRFTAFLFAICLSFSVLTPVNAATLDYNFSFTNTANGGGFVEGIIRGLMDNATSSATSVEVTGNSAGFGIGEYVGTPFTNAWVVASGVIVDFDFQAPGGFNSAPFVTDSSLLLIGPSGASVAGLSNLPLEVGNGEDTGLSFSLITPVPVPAPLALLAAALAGLGGLAWKKRQTALRA